MDELACVPTREPAELLDADLAADAAVLFKALGDPVRVRLLHYIAQAEEGTICACELPEELGISQPTMSHHLGKLVAAGLLEREQHGRWAFYRATPGGIAAQLRLVLGEHSPTVLP